MLLRTHSSDSTVVRRILGGKPDEFAVLVKRYLGLVHAIAYAHVGNHADAEDVTQEAFVKAFESLDTLREPAKFRRWLLMIARNESHRLGWRNHRRQEIHTQFTQETRDNETNDIERQELHDMLHRLIAELDAEHREVLTLYYFAQEDTRAIATTLDISVDAAKKRLQRARAALGDRVVTELEEYAERRRPTAETAARVIAAISQASPVWLGAAGAGHTAGGLVGNLLGGRALCCAIVAAGSLVAVVYGGSQLAEQAAPETSIREMDVAVNIPSEAEETGESVAADTVEPTTPAIQTVDDSDIPEMKPIVSQADTASPAKHIRRAAIEPKPMAGGNPQRTNYVPYNGPLEMPGILWQVPLGELGSQPCAQVIRNECGNLYLNFGDEGRDYMACYSPNGDLVWQTGPFEGRRSLCTPVSTAAGAIVMGFRDQTFRAFDSATGDEMWSVELPADVRGLMIGSPVYDEAGDLYITGGAKAGLLKVDVANGSVVWRQQVPDEVDWHGTASCPTLSHDGATIYVGRGSLSPGIGEGGIYAVDAQSGTTRWRYTPEDVDLFNVGWPSPMVGPDGTVYQQNEQDGRLYAIDDRGDEGVLKWSFNTGSVRNCPRFPAVDEDTVYVGSIRPAATVFALDFDGNVKWEHALTDMSMGSPVVTPDAVYVLSAIEGILLALDRDDGAELWRMPVARAMFGDTGEAVTIAPDGTLYLATAGRPGEDKQSVLLAIAEEH